MTDKHLNLFYSYNRDNELVEDNLTRAFIATLSLLSEGIVRKFLKIALLRNHFPGENQLLPTDNEFKDLNYALQSNIEMQIPRNATRKILLTISTDPLEFDDIQSHIKTSISSDELFGSRPDAWIFDTHGRLCILIESKVGTNPLHIGQLEGHVHDWFDLTLHKLQLGAGITALTWIDILAAIDEVTSVKQIISHQEILLLAHLAQFINYCGYRLFKGVIFADLLTPPDSVNMDQFNNMALSGLPLFSDLVAVPESINRVVKGERH